MSLLKQQHMYSIPEYKRIGRMYDENKGSFMYAGPGRGTKTGKNVLEEIL